MPNWFAPPSNEGFREAAVDEKLLAQNLAAVHSMINMGKAKHARVHVLLHWTQEELRYGASQPGWRPRGLIEIGDAARADGAEVLDLGPEEQQTDARAYRDNIHINAIGQRAMEGQLLNLLVR